MLRLLDNWYGLELSKRSAFEPIWLLIGDKSHE
jgi:hypothetical protein